MMGGTAQLESPLAPKERVPRLRFQLARMWAEGGASNIGIRSLAAHPKETNQWVLQAQETSPHSPALRRLQGEGAWAGREPGTLGGGPRTEQSSTLPGATEEAREGPAARCHRAQSATLGRQGAAGDKGPALGCREMPWPQGTDCSLGAPGPPSRSSGSISPGEAGLPCLEGGSVATGMGPRRCEERKPEVGTLRGRLHPRGQ